MYAVDARHAEVELENQEFGVAVWLPVGDAAQAVAEAEEDHESDAGDGGDAVRRAQEVVEGRGACSWRVGAGVRVGLWVGVRISDAVSST